MGEPLLALELLAVALAASLGAECTAGLALLEPVTAKIDLFGPKVLILRNFTGCACAKQDSKICWAN